MGGEVRKWTSYTKHWCIQSRKERPDNSHGTIAIDNSKGQVFLLFGARFAITTSLLLPRSLHVFHECTK